MKKGRFIAIEGLDGSGKTTQIELLVKYCRRKQIKTAVFDFPQYYKTFFGKMVGRYLKADFGRFEKISPYLASLSYAGDRWQVSGPMKKTLADGKLLLVNRYTPSSMAFMGAKIKNKEERDKFIRWLIKLEWRVYKIPQPELVIYLSVSSRIAQKLVDKKGRRKYVGNKNGRDIHERNLSYLQKVAAIYLSLGQRFDNWVKIDCLDKKGSLETPKEIHEKIIKVLKRRKII